MALFDEAIANQEGRSTSLEQRGAAIATVSGSLVTLLVGVAVIAGVSESELETALASPSAKIMMISGLVCFSIAVLASIAVQAPRPYRRVGNDALSTLSGSVEFWRDEDEAVALWRTAEAKAKIVQAAANSNRSKARWLTGAYAAQALAIAAVAAALGSALVASF